MMMEIIRYLLVDFWKQETDSRIKEYPLMNGGPWLSWTIVIVYIFIVKIFGPKFMKKRPAFNLKPVIIIYNIILIQINVYFFYQYSIVNRFGIDLNIHRFERISSEQSSSSSCSLNLFYMFMLSKYLDMIETIIFLLRKKFQQITTLHVYHHSIAPILVHLYIKISPCGGPGTIFPLLNSFVHTVMYIYYTLSALGLRRYTWWKKYVTQLQLTQFVIFGIIQPVIFFAMFFSFYKRAYRLSSDKRQRQSKTMNIMDTIDTNTNNNNKMTNGSTETIINADDEDNNRICQNGHINGNKTNGHIVVDNKKNE
ncbi:very long chain fatty acid elongase 1-like isoform X3 [Dermatophagoides pteronyssinus]|uniref:very long chain fatty acid elongase 1-like isoform X3 n=1 Tax=Dermatophagoides pteronyssinus TaxID=6956 RepID=UPI003F67C91B